MTIFLNPVVGFNSTVQAKHQYILRFSAETSSSKALKISYPLGTLGSQRLLKGKRSVLCLSVADRDRLTTDTSDKGSEDVERFLDNGVSAGNPTSLDSPGGNNGFQTSGGNEPSVQASEGNSGPLGQSDLKQKTSSSPDLQSQSKRSPLTARERLKSARVLNRYAESKASKLDMGSKVLDALRESDKGKKKSRLPEAPTNLFDDSKRGLPKQGLTFQFPGGSDLFIIVFSFVFISTVMFATTYLVWKVGAIHFNEY